MQLNQSVGPNESLANPDSGHISHIVQDDRRDSVATCMATVSHCGYQR